MTAQFRVCQGASLIFELQCTEDEDGEIGVPLTGATDARLQIRESGDSETSLLDLSLDDGITITDEDNGVVQYVITPEHSAALPYGDHFMAGTVTLASGVVVTMVDDGVLRVRYGVL